MADIAYPRANRSAGVSATANRAAGGPSLWSLTAMERRKILKRPMSWVVFLMMAGGTAGIIMLAYLSTRNLVSDANAQASGLAGYTLPGGIAPAFEIAGMLGQILLAVLAASLVGGEYGWGTIRGLVASGASRGRLLAAKLFALGQITLVFLAASFAAGAGMSLLVTIAGGHDLTLGTVDAAWFGDLTLMFARTALVLFVPVALAFTAASLTRSVAVGIGVSIGVIVLESVLGVFLLQLGDTGKLALQALISTNQQALLQRNGFGPQEIGSLMPGGWQAAGVLAVYCVIGLGAAFAVFRRRDVTLGS